MFTFVVPGGKAERYHNTAALPITPLVLAGGTFGPLVGESNLRTDKGLVDRSAWAFAFADSALAGLPS